jgi:hypothetical protein
MYDNVGYVPYLQFESVCPFGLGIVELDPVKIREPVGTANSHKANLRESSAGNPTRSGATRQL